MTQQAGYPRVTLEPRSLSSLRHAAAPLRCGLALAALAGIAASVRFAVAPPTRVTVVRPRIEYGAGSALVAEQFVRSYLSWGAGQAGSDAASSALLGPSGAGPRPAPGSSEAVSWVTIVSSAATPDGGIDYVVAADTTLNGVVAVGIDVRQASDGRYAITRLPSIVAAPVGRPAGALENAGLPVVANGQLASVLERALGNYLSGSKQDLAADLTPGASVSVPSLRLRLRAVERLALEPSGAVLATVVATDAKGDSYTLSYDLAVVHVAGRWELTSIDS